ncbi:thioredoxin-like protein [Parasitella parasitica]|nr:thioredoxin-like protein [Parasitella parasitica]
MARPAIQERKRDPRVLAVEFIEAFEQNYGSDHVEFFRGGYSQALEKARKDLRFMMVFLHSDDHDDTDTFCRHTLTAERLVNFIRDKKIIVWAGNVREAEAHKVSNTLNASTYPFMALIALQGTTAPRMAVIERIEGTCHPEELISQIDIAMDRHGAVINRLLNERQHREMERQLIVDQDAAFNESLKQDREKARLVEEEKQRQQEVEQEKIRQQQLAELQEQKRQQYIRYLFSHLPQEPTSDCARLNFRLADGDRVIRQFDQNATVDDLYQFVEVYPLVKEHGSCAEEKVEAPSDYAHAYKFTMHTPYPRMELPPSQQKLIDIKSLWPSAALVVEDDADPEDEE